MADLDLFKSLWTSDFPPIFLNNFIILKFYKAMKVSYFWSKFTLGAKFSPCSNITDLASRFFSISFQLKDFIINV